MAHLFNPPYTLASFSPFVINQRSTRKCTSCLDFRTCSRGATSMPDPRSISSYGHGTHRYFYLTICAFHRAKNVIVPRFIVASAVSAGAFDGSLRSCREKRDAALTDRQRIRAEKRSFAKVSRGKFQYHVLRSKGSLLLLL